MLICFFVIYFFYHKIRVEKNEAIDKKLIFNNEEIRNISLYLAHLLSEDLHTFSPYYDFNEVVNVLSEIERGKTPLLPPEECRMALIDYEYKILEEDERKKSEEVNQFLIKLAMNENVVEINKGKLYYETIREGLGAIITEDSVPLIHFTEYDLFETVLQDTRNNEPRRILLKETPPGFKKGILGMKVGERRRIYIHSDLAYAKVGKYSQYQLIIFDVEIIDVT